MKIRALRADEVECRVAQVSQKGCQLLLYKDARCDKRILDETFGITGWQNRYEEIKGNLFCTISIFDSVSGQWVFKQDCGTESNVEKEKGEASDAFKRACFNVGIGRELYSKIFIWINCETEKVGTTYKLVDKYAKFHVSEMVVDEEAEKITSLKIEDSKGNVVFTYNHGKKTQPKAEPKEVPKATPKTEPTEEPPTDETFDEMLGELKFISIEQANKMYQTANGNVDLIMAVFAELGYASSKEVPVSKFDEIMKKIVEKVKPC